MLVEDCLFHFIHKFLHWRVIYPYIHKVHHEYRSSIGLAAEHFHPIEYILASLPSVVGAKILGKKMHAYTFLAWSFVRIVEIVDGHSGYEFPWNPFR